MAKMSCFRYFKLPLSFAVVLCWLTLSLHATDSKPSPDVQNYQLGPEDQVSIRVMDLEKLQLDNASAPKIDVNGDLALPIIGHIHAAGLTIMELEKEIVARLSSILQNPNVSVGIVQYRSHPVSVLGAVRNPGVFQVTGPRRLLEVLSLANGLATDAGDKITVTRRKSNGVLPLADNKLDDSGSVYVGHLDVRPLIRGTDPSLNIEVREYDVITVTPTEFVYVVGAVKKAGGFSLGERQHISILQALSLAEGLDTTASAKNVRLLREAGPGKERQEIAVNLKPIMAGTAPDVPLRANDILFVPTNGTKQAAMRGIEAALQLGTGALIRY